jgi:UDP-glucose 4-epimerase
LARSKVANGDIDQMPTLYDQCAKLASLENERILIFGGSGSLGKTSIKRWISNNIICNVSRDEEKQWALRMSVYNHSNLNQRIGDISCLADVQSAILFFKPTIICVYACLKHIDLCEKQPDKAISTNSNGIMNVHSVLSSVHNSVKSVLYVSTDKACLPITTYGCSKALGEFFVQGINDMPIKWVGVRYGNVLNSSGSIIPYLNTNGSAADPYKLTHPDMTRFLMTLDQSVNLLEYALIHGRSNEIIIPYIASMRISELFELFEEKFKKTHVVSGLRCKEKIHEDLLSPIEAANSYIENGYIHLTPDVVKTGGVSPFSSNHSLVDKSTLRDYLIDLGLY